MIETPRAPSTLRAALFRITETFDGMWLRTIAFRRPEAVRDRVVHAVSGAPQNGSRKDTECGDGDAAVAAADLPPHSPEERRDGKA
jgi:hypothetical protein